MNVKKIIKSGKIDPLHSLISKIYNNPDGYFDEYRAYKEAYYFYYLSMERLFQEISIARRWRNSCFYILKYGGKYSTQERKIATKYNSIKKYIRLDYVNFTIHARILLDRILPLIRNFFDGHKNKPSFISFADHKKFFLRNNDISFYKPFEQYAHYLRNCTDWFDNELKFIRDKFFVHHFSGPKHLKFTGFPNSGVSEMEYIFIVFETSGKPLTNTKKIICNANKLVEEINKFLNFFNNYWISKLE